MDTEIVGVVRRTLRWITLSKTLTHEKEGSMRKKCLNKGHKFKEIQGVNLPFIYCSRWRCQAAAVSRWADPSFAVSLHNAIPREHRFPPVELNEDNTIKEEFKEGVG
jgi:hypothetical protein